MTQDPGAGAPKTQPLYHSPWLYATYVNAVLLLVLQLPIETSLGIRFLILTPVTAIPFALTAAGWDDRVLGETSRLPPRITFIVGTLVLSLINLLAWGSLLATWIAS